MCGRRVIFYNTYPVTANFVFGEGEYATLTLYEDNRVFIESEAGSGYGTWELKSVTDSERKYTVYDPDGESHCLVILSNGEAIFDPETDNIRGNWGYS